MIMNDWMNDYEWLNEWLRMIEWMITNDWMNDYEWLAAKFKLFIIRMTINQDFTVHN